MDWDARYAEGDTPWDKGAAHPVLFDALTQDVFSGRVLVPGCGTGHDARALAARGHRVTGLDISPLALERARSLPHPDNLDYHLGDLFSLPREMHGAFDGVFEHTCFCAIDPSRRTDYVMAVANALKSGGRLLAVFFLDPQNDGTGPPYGCTRGEIGKYFDPCFGTVWENSEFSTFPEREGRELLMLLERV